MFCNPAEGHEKGLVEGLVGWARRNILVPVPYAPDLSGLNTLLLERCTKYEAHQIKGKPAKVGAMMDEERPMFHPLPGYRFETAKSVNVRVNAFSTARFRTNSYSDPVQYTGRMVGIKGYPETVEIYYKGSLIAVHTRCYGKHQSIYHLEHYMPLLEERRRAIPNAAPVKQNVPSEVLDALCKNSSNYSRMVSILHDFVDQEKPKIQDTVKILSVDLRQYDQLSRREEVNNQ